MLRRTIFSFALILLAHLSLSAQEAAPASSEVCPTIRVECPYVYEWPDKPIVFRAIITGGDLGVKPIYKWSVSGCRIIAGQGTPTLTVDELRGGASFTATLQVEGFPAECNHAALCSFIIESPQRAHMFDEYGSLALRDEKPRISLFAIELDNFPGAQGYIIAYTGRRRRNRTGQHLQILKDYLIEQRGIDAGRIVTIDGGHRRQASVELWIVPTGAAPPELKPSQ